MNLLETIKEDDVWVLCKSDASHVATLSEQLRKIICPARFIQQCCGKHPSSSPLHACNYRVKGVCSMHSRRWTPTSPNFFTPADIEKVENEFWALNTAYFQEETSRKQNDAGGPNESFEAAWQPIQKRFPVLSNFVGGLATVFPGTQVWSPISPFWSGQQMSFA